LDAAGGPASPCPATRPARHGDVSAGYPERYLDESMRLFTARPRRSLPGSWPCAAQEPRQYVFVTNTAFGGCARPRSGAPCLCWKRSTLALAEAGERRSGMHARVTTSGGSRQHRRSHASRPRASPAAAPAAGQVQGLHFPGRPTERQGTRRGLPGERRSPRD